MKLRDLEKHLNKNGCMILRQGGNHTIYRNIKNNKKAPVPRHREIKDMLVNKICNQLEILLP